MSFAQPFSNYEILARIGAGAMGTVFKARQKHMNRIVALKVLKPALARDERFVERLRREARIVGKLNHPNIVTGYDLGEEGGYHFFVMEYVEGRSLRQLLHEWGMFPEEQVLDVAIQIAGALAHAYDCGVIHRDVKPANILIDSEGRVKLTDMGLAKVETDLQLTREGATVGTPQYISPEQARDPRSADARSDLYSLGATLFHMATGQTPFHADTIGELITKVLHDRPPTAISVNPALGDGLSLVIRKLLSKDPELRYQTPAELLVDLQRLKRHEKPAIDRAERDALGAAGEAGHPGAETAVERPRRIRTLWVAAATAVAALVGAVSLLGWPGVGDRGARELSGSTARFEIEWRAATTFRAKAAVIAEGRTAGVDELVLAAALDALESEMRLVLEDTLASWRGARRSEAAAWLGAADHFADAGAFVGERVVPDLVDQLGFEPEALPSAGLRRDASQGLAELRTSLDAWCEGLVDGFLRRVERHLRGPVRDSAAALARARDFDAATQVVEGGVDDFLGREGRPARDQLMQAAGARLAELESLVQAELLAEVAGARRAAQRQVLVEVEAGLAALDRVRELDASVPARLAALGRVAARLQVEATAAEQELGPFDPELRADWDAASARLSAVGLEVDALRAGVREAAAAEALAFSYRCLLEAGPAAAIAALDAGGDPAATLAGLAEHRAALESSQVLAMSLAAAARARVDEARIRPGVGDGWVDATGRPISFGDVDWAAQLSAAGMRSRGDEPLGRAVLLLAAGRHADAADGLSVEGRTFVETQVWPLLRAARAAERSATVRTADAALSLAVERRAAGDAAGLRAALDDIDARFPFEPTAPTAGLRAELRLWLAAQERRQELMAAARKRVPDGFELRLLDEDALRAEGDLDLRVQSASPVREVPVPFARPDAVRVEIEVRFPRADRLASGLAMQLGGVAVSLAVLPDGQVAAVMAQGSVDVLTDDDTLRRALAGPLASAVDLAPQVTHGAWHRLQIQWAKRRGEAVEAEIRWGGVEGALLASGRFSPREPAGALSLRALGPIEIRHVVVDATSVGG